MITPHSLSSIPDEVTLIVESPLMVLDSFPTSDEVESFARSVLYAVDSTLHAYGVTAQGITLKVSKTQVHLFLSGSAGSFAFERTFYSDLADHPVRTLCNKILRFLRRKNADIQ